MKNNQTIKKEIEKLKGIISTLSIRLKNTRGDSECAAAMKDIAIYDAKLETLIWVLK